MKKSFISRLYKKIISHIFFIVYGKIFNSKYYSKNVIIKKINKIENTNVKKFNYKIFKIKDGRIFTNYVESLAVIQKKSLIKEVSFQQINGKLYKSNNDKYYINVKKLVVDCNTDSNRIDALDNSISGLFEYITDTYYYLNIAKKIEDLSGYYLNLYTNVNKKKEFTFHEDIDMSIVSKKIIERLKEMYKIKQR